MVVNPASVSLLVTSASWAQVLSRSGWSKIDRTRVAIIGQVALVDPGGQVRHEVGPAPLPGLASESTAAMAALMPPWASEMTSSTPLSPRATRERRKAVQAAVSSVVTMSKPTISRVPSALTAVAMTAETLTTRPPSLTRWVSASIHR
jgi:hypothetical protein